MIGTNRILLIAIVTVALGALAAQEGQAAGVLRANGQNEIVLDGPAIVDNTSLPAGTYKLHSKDSRTTHQVYFMRETKLETVFPHSSSVVVYDEAARVNCKIKLKESKTKATTLHYVEQDGSMRMVSADIKGKSQSYIFIF